MPLIERPLVREPALRGRRVLLSINRNSRRGGEPIHRVIERLQRAGLKIEQINFTCPTKVTSTLMGRRDEFDCIVIGGGDGTLNCAAEGLIQAGLPMGILPLGTANDLARTLEIPSDLDAAADVIIQGLTRAIDVGDVNGCPFFNVASIGLSVELAKTLTPETKRRWGRFSYAIAALRILARARPFRALIESKESVAHVETLQIAIGNGRYYGSGMTVETSATIDDRCLDLYSLEVGSIWKLVFMLSSFREGSHGALREVRTIKCTNFEVRTNEPRPVNVDGELVTLTPARFTIKPAAVLVYVPSIPGQTSS